MRRSLQTQLQNRTRSKELTRYVDEKYSLQGPSKLRPQLPRRFNRLIDEEALATNTEGVQHVEGIIPQPAEELGLEAAQGEGEVRVADDLGDAPGDQHARVGQTGSQAGEDVDDGPYQQQTAGDLHSGGEDRRAHDT
jgi:hypothetical protein